MRRLRRLAELPAAERWLLAEAALAVLVVRVGLWLVSFRRLCSWLDRLSTWQARTHFPPERIAWAVIGVSYYIPAASCLTQALAAKALLARRGVAARLRIGVAKDAQQTLAAHAWLEVAGHALIGGAILQEYTPLPDLEGTVL
jgi:hypothetical protein